DPPGHVEGIVGRVVAELHGMPVQACAVRGIHVLTEDAVTHLDRPVVTVDPAQRHAATTDRRTKRHVGRSVALRPAHHLRADGLLPELPRLVEICHPKDVGLDHRSHAALTTLLIAVYEIHQLRGTRQGGRAELLRRTTSGCPLHERTNFCSWRALRFPEV